MSLFSLKKLLAESSGYVKESAGTGSAGACPSQRFDSCIVLAELVIKHEGLRIPQSYAEAFDILGDNRVLTADFAYRFASIAGFRNFLAHDYEKIDQEVICGQVMSRLDDADIFLQQIRDSLDLGF